MRAYIMMMLLRFTKTRIETSNLLEKGLIQKTVYLVGTIEKVTDFLTFSSIVRIQHFHLIHKSSYIKRRIDI
jgi:hypothetical protein